MNTPSAAPPHAPTEGPPPAFFRGDNVVVDFIAPRTILYVHNGKVPSENDDVAVRDLYRRVGPQLGKCICLVITDGGAPSRSQRERASQEFGPVVRDIRSAIVSDAATVRFAIATMTLLIKHIASFNVPYFEDAVAFLNMSGSEQGALRSHLRALSMALPPGQYTTFDGVCARAGLQRLFR